MIIRGNKLQGLQRGTGGTLTWKEDGSVEGREKFYCVWSSVPKLAPIRNKTAHPDFTSLICSTCNAIRQKGGVAELVATYTGFFGSAEGGGDPAAEDWIQELTSAAQTAPIETHPDFSTSIGGTAAGPINGAVYDSNGIFQGFDSDSIFAGLRSYLIPSVTYRLRRSTGSKPTSVADVGKISTPPVNLDTGGRNWMLMNRAWRRSGAAYELSEEWLLSGEDGWDPVIYPP